MKLKYLCIALATAVLGVTACQPDEYSLGGSAYTADDLQQGLTYTVTPDAENGNIIHLKSNVTGVTPQWILTDGSTSQKSSVDINVPFAGTYSVTFGVSSPAGIIYGAPYEFTVKANDFSMLSDPKWGYLAGGVGKTKTWVPIDQDYGVGQTAGPMTYCNPEDVLNDGSAKTELAFEAWAPNWDPGIQSWLFSDQDGYLYGSSMTFGLDATKGCTFSLVRGDDGDKQSGAFTLNLDDATKPTIAFSGGGYVLHMSNFDDVCSNYTGAGSPLQILELTEYCLQIATERTNAEGKWWLVWSFVPEGVRDGTIEIPKDAQDLAKADVVEIADQDLANSLFTITTDDNGNVFAESVTYNINTDQPYGFYWWNGGKSAWEASAEGDYGEKAWYPAATNAIEDFSLILSRAADGSYSFEEEASGTKGSFTISGNSIVFEKAIEFITADGVAVNTNEITVVKANYENNEFYFAVPYETNEKGSVSKYVYANLTQKSIGGGATGPTVVSLETDTNEHMWVEKNCLRLAFWSYGSGGEGIFSDVTKVKLKKNQTITVKFKISGVNWAKTPKCALIDNNIKQTWEPGCYDLADAVEVNTTGETTVSLKNTTDGMVKFTDTCFDLSIQGKGYGSLADGTEIADGVDLSTVTIEIVSCTIE